MDDEINNRVLGLGSILYTIIHCKTRIRFSFHIAPKWAFKKYLFCWGVCLSEKNYYLGLTPTYGINWLLL